MSIRTRLIWLTLLAAALPASLQLWRFAQDRARAIDADTARLEVLAQRRAEVVTDRIQGTQQLLYGLARARDLDTDDRDACSSFLSDVREKNPQYTGILTIKPDGSLFCDSLRTGRQLDLRDRGYFKAALLSTDGVVLEPVFGRLTGVAVLQIAHAVRSPQGELQFVLLASLNLPKLIEISLRTLPGSRLMLLDRAGTVLAIWPADPRTAAGATVAGTPMLAFASQSKVLMNRELPSPSGEPGVWAVGETPVTQRAGLHVLAGAPKSALLAAANRRFAQDVGLLGLMAMGVFLAVWLVFEKGIRQQIARITGMTTRLAAGELSARIHPPLPRGELGALMTELNQTAQSLQQQRADIEQLNDRLRQSQRLEAVGQLTGGVAHDFNNLLTVIMGNAELLAEQNEGNPQQQMMAQMIGNAAERGAELTQRLLAFARKQALDPKAVDLNQLVAGMDTMLRRTLGEHLRLELIRGAGLWLALVDQGQLENAVLNLCVNARDAMPDGGRLTLETANARLDADYAEHHADVTPGQYVMLAVSDTGQGIAPENLQRVFEPFFTTKERGKGTGLGLAMVYGFVKQSSGHVSIYSEPGHGTTVKLYLPRAAGDRPEATEPAPVDVYRGGTETVLLVEDDEDVRRYAREQLLAFGYRVFEAGDGPAALAIVEQRDDIDLLFTDVVMPGGMNGRQLADAARRLRPGLRVLYSSGYTENAIVHHGRLDPDALLLSKPYRRGDLDRALRSALDPARRT